MLLLASARTSPADPLTFRKQETWSGKMPPRTSTILLTRNPADPRLSGWCARQQREVMQKRRNRTEPLVLVIDPRRLSDPPESPSVSIEFRGYSFFEIFSGSSRTRHIRCQESRHDQAVWPAIDRGTGYWCPSLMPSCGTRNDENGAL